jgi:DNA-binding transcriptional ArsR family regulator
MAESEFTEDQLLKASEMLKAMAHPIRVSILYYLKDGEKKTVSQIQGSLEIEQSVTSHHLGILKDKGVLCSKREGKNIYYFSKHPILGQMLDCMKSCSCGE